MASGDNQRRLYRIERQPDPVLDAMRLRQEGFNRAAARVLAWCCTAQLIAVALAAGLICHACIPALLSWVQQ